jgi:hypothetical protein
MAIMTHNKAKVPLVIRWFVGVPLVWMMLPTILVSDFVIEIYHRIAFPILGIPYVKRSQYIRIFDRTKLPYLTWYEKIGCAYCGYANGWYHYALTIAGETEKYYCAVAHLEARGYVAPEHEKSFATYNNEGELKDLYKDL